MLINTHVDGLGQFMPRIQLYIFSDSIEHNDRIIDGITNDKESAARMEMVIPYSVWKLYRW